MNDDGHSKRRGAGSRLSYSTSLEDPNLKSVFDLNVQPCSIFMFSNLKGIAQKFWIALIDAIV